MKGIVIIQHMQYKCKGLGLSDGTLPKDLLSTVFIEMNYNVSAAHDESEAAIINMYRCAYSFRLIDEVFVGKAHLS